LRHFINKILKKKSSISQNTDFVEGICVYAGHETKAMLNNSGPRYKRSQLEQQMNIDVIWCVIILIILCVIGAVGCRMWLSSFTSQPIPFLPFDIDPNYEGLLSFWTFVIILQVSIEQHTNYDRFINAFLVVV
jgi:phospholipid-translocating ATPase